MAKTLFDKIWDAHVVQNVEDGPTQLYIDRLYAHEVTSPQAFDTLRDKGIKAFRPDHVIAMPDHNTPSDQQEVINDPVGRKQVETLKANCEEFGIKHFAMGTKDNGIIHVVGPEKALSLPGMTIVCGDSHTSTHGAVGAIAEVPSPRGDGAVRLVLEADGAGVGHDSVGPLRLDGLVETGLERHEGEEALHGGIAKHLMVLGEVPEAVFLLAAIVVDDGPAETYLLTFVECTLHGLVGAVGAGVVEGGDVEFEAQHTVLAVTELIVVGVVGIRQLLEPLLRAPHHGPRLALGGGRHDVIVLGMDVLELEKRLQACLGLGVDAELIGVRAAREVGIDHDLVRVVAQAQLVEVPIVVVGLVVEVEAVQAVHPAHLDLDVEGALIDRGVLAAVVPHLVDGDDIRVGDDVPVGKLTVDAGDGRSRELKDLESRFANLNGLRLDTRHGRKPQGSSKEEGEMLHED